MENPASVFGQARVARIESGTLEGQRPRVAGSNARLGEHGSTVRTTIMRITTDDGLSGFGACRANAEIASGLLGAPLADAFGDDGLVADDWLSIEFPLWDALGRATSRPVYALLADATGKPVPTYLSPRCYDTSLYFDDLALGSESDAADLLASEALEGFARGHRAFKIKIGRGARHMPLEIGVRRDIAVIRAIREAVGPESQLMVDANNGFNLNLTKRVLHETRDVNLTWFEEPFHEDDVLYQDLKAWLKEQNLDVLIADGEGEASTRLLSWAERGLINVVQYDIIDRGLTNWVRTSADLDRWGVHTAPHIYGGFFGGYACAHLSAVVDKFLHVEWDTVDVPSLDGSQYEIQDGRLLVPDAPGFGLGLDEQLFSEAVVANGFDLKA